MTESAHQTAPSPWIARFAPLISDGGDVLDLACGDGCHARLLASMGYQVEAVARDAAVLTGLTGVDGVSTRCADLEAGPWPYYARAFDGIVVSCYLWRPILPQIFNCLGDGGVLIYETFMEGQQFYGQPDDPARLLRVGELLGLVGKRFTVIAFEQGETDGDQRQVFQRVCVRRGRPLSLSPCLP